MKSLWALIKSLLGILPCGHDSTPEDIDPPTPPTRLGPYPPAKLVPKHKAGYRELLEIGRPPKSAESEYPGVAKAPMTIAEFPGDWNNGKPRLYLLKDFQPYLHEALVRCEKLGVLESIKRIGCYNHRKIRHNVKNGYSPHAWGAAVDIDHKQNFAVSKGYRPMPFSKQWLSVYPAGLSWPVVRAFLSVGLTWGGCWHRTKWIDCVQELGVGYDEQEAMEKYKAAYNEWQTDPYVDPMHFEYSKR